MMIGCDVDVDFDDDVKIGRVIGGTKVPYPIFVTSPTSGPGAKFSTMNPMWTKSNNPYRAKCRLPVTPSKNTKFSNLRKNTPSQRHPSLFGPHILDMFNLCCFTNLFTFLAHKSKCLKMRWSTKNDKYDV